MNFNLRVTFTNFIGAICLLWAVYLKYDYAIAAGVILILGRQAENILKAWKGQNTNA